MEKQIIFAFFFCLSIQYLYSQDTIYYDHLGKKTKGSDCNFYKVITYLSKDSCIVIERKYLKSGIIQEENSYANFKQNILHGKVKEWFSNGQLKKDIDYNNNEFDGNVITYWSNGNIKRIDIFSNGKLLSGTCYDSIGLEIKYFDYIQYPEFKGGNEELMNFIDKNTNYPEDCRGDEIHGTVYVRFIIESNGEVSNTIIVRSVHHAMDTEVLRVIKKMPNWNPGRIDGETTRFSFVLPIRFHIKK